jgi:hypothetical protein
MRADITTADRRRKPRLHARLSLRSSARSLLPIQKVINGKRPEGGITMTRVRWQVSSIQTVSPEEHAALVAGDQFRARQVYDHLIRGETTDALQIVAAEAGEIQALCTYMPVTSAISTNESLNDSILSIEMIGDRSRRMRDSVQALWCRMLIHKLEEER